MLEVIEEVIPMFEVKKIYFEGCIPQNIPEMLLDAMSIRRLIMNLIFNAWQYSEPNSSVTLNVIASNISLNLQIRNSGTIPKEVREKDIFD